MSNEIVVALIGLAVPVLGFLGLWLQLRQQNRILLAQGVVLNKVKEQSDGILSRAEAKTSEAKSATIIAQQETAAAVAAGVEDRVAVALAKQPE